MKSLLIFTVSGLILMGLAIYVDKRSNSSSPVDKTSKSVSNLSLGLGAVLLIPLGMFLIWLLASWLLDGLGGT